VLELGLGRSQRHGELAEHLSVPVQCVACVAPSTVGEVRPQHGHRPHASANAAVGKDERTGDDEGGMRH